MEIVRLPAVPFRRLGLLPGTFNPPTRAHVALAHAALAHVDAVLFVLPRRLPHKTWEAAPAAARLEMLTRIADTEPRLGVAVSGGGLYLEVGREGRAATGCEISLVCGRDAAERIAAWQHEPREGLDQLLQEFDLLVSPRTGEPQLDVPNLRILAAIGCDAVSATEVRERIRAGIDWADLVPETIHDLVRANYV